MTQEKPLLISLDQITSLVLAGAPQDTDTRSAEMNQIAVGELLTVVVVMAANVVRDIRENIRNLVGGRMTHYEKLIENAVEAALADLARKAQARGYDGVAGVKISHPQVVDGGVEVIVYGNGFTYVEGNRTPQRLAQTSLDEA